MMDAFLLIRDFHMSISQRLINTRRQNNLTQQEMADRVGLHVNQIRRYEAENAQPSLDALKKIAIAMHISIDALVFEENERDPDDDLRLQFEAVNHFDEEDKKVVKALLEGLILKHEAKRVSEMSG